jgi:molecular chaperone GrpE
MTEPKKTKHQDPKQDSGVGTPASAEATAGGQDSAKQEAANEANKKIEELTNHLARCMADLQNYRRRSEEDKGRFVKFANAEMIKILLPALENLDRSCKHLPEALKEDAWAKGVLHTQVEITKAMDKIGVKRIETVGKKMDLKFHEVLMQGPGEKEMITEELDPGYTLNGETIKAAKVKVGDGSK